MAFFGGTFDPVHIGHLRIAVQLRESGFANVQMIPNRVPPHRTQPQASATDRHKMLTDACSSLDGIEVNDLELHGAGFSYTAQTVATLRRQYPEQSLTWVMGADAWAGFDRWFEPETVLNNVNILVVSRPNEPLTLSGEQGQWYQQRQVILPELLKKQHGAICHHPLPELDISASNLRQAIKQGDNIVYLTPDSVREYIIQQQLYR